MSIVQYKAQISLQTKGLSLSLIAMTRAPGEPCEVGFGETKSPARTNLKAHVLGGAKELDGVISAVLVIDCNDKGGDGSHVLHQLSGAFDDDRFVGVICRDRASRVRGKAACL
jgi:hypothetical protein